MNNLIAIFHRVAVCEQTEDPAEAKKRGDKSVVNRDVVLMVTPGTLTEAWAILHAERGAITWLEDRRFWDERRWFAESGPPHFDFLNGRDKCIPISKTEKDSNPNIP